MVHCGLRKTVLQPLQPLPLGLGWILISQLLWYILDECFTWTWHRSFLFYYWFLFNIMKLDVQVLYLIFLILHTLIFESLYFPKFCHTYFPSLNLIIWGLKYNLYLTLLIFELLHFQKWCSNFFPPCQKLKILKMYFTHSWFLAIC